MRHRLLPILFLSVFLVCSGCGGPKKPANMPDLRPVKLTLTQDGKPLAGAQVTLIPEGSAKLWSAGGFSDQHGAVNCMTHGKYPGAAAGTYKVCVLKQEVVGADPESSKIYDLVDPKFSDAERTGLRLTVPTSEKTTTFDLGPSVRIERVSEGP